MRVIGFWILVLTVPMPGRAQDPVTRSLIDGAWSGQPAAVRSALASGRVDVDVRSGEGNTPLMLASLAGHDAVVDLLIEAGADPNLANDGGETALILAAKYGFNDVAAKLIEAGAELDHQDQSGRTAWTWASWGENDSLVSLLKASGADEMGKSDPFDGGAPVDRFETRPDMTRYRPPDVPKELRESGVVGTLVLRVVVDRDGKARSVELVEGLHEELDQNALEAAEKWRFEPGEIQKRPVDGVVTVRIEYGRGHDPEGRVVISTRRWRN